MGFFSESVAIIFKQPFTQRLGKLEVDIVSSRIISEKVTITNNPIEGGFNTDNAKDEPTQISITGIISKYSLKNSKIAQVTNIISGDISNRLKDAHDELYRIKNDKEPITLAMKYKQYANMLLSDLNFIDEANSGETLRFTAIFKEINIVESQLVSFDNSRIKTDSAKKTSSFGRQTGSEKTINPKSTITLRQFIKSLF